MATTRLQQGLRATFIGLAVNTMLAIVKLVGGVLGHSHALVADAVESLADVLSSLVVWRGLVVAAAPADADHPYGHGKAEPLAAATVATMLLLAAVGITVHALREVFEPKQGPAPFTLVVLLAVVAIKEGLFRFVLREGRTMESSAVLTDAWHHRSDVITSIAAAIGISVALIGGKGYESADSIAAVVAAGMIAWNGWRLLRPALDELMDTAPGRTFTEEVERIAGTIPGTEKIEKCVIRKVGFRYFVDMHVEVDPGMTVSDAHGIAHRVKDAVRTQLPQVADVLVHIEPRRG
jgi:cation diffusion facilitator family transporter